MKEYLICSIPCSLCARISTILSWQPILTFSIISLMHRNSCAVSTLEIVLPVLCPIPLPLPLRNGEKSHKTVFFISFPMHFLNSISLAAMTFSITLQLHWDNRAVFILKILSALPIPGQLLLKIKKAAKVTNTCLSNLSPEIPNIQYMDIFVSLYLCTLLQCRGRTTTTHHTSHTHKFNLRYNHLYDVCLLTEPLRHSV